MMVIEHTRGANTTIYPADRCTWRIVQDADGYHVQQVEFVGAPATIVTLHTAGDRVAFGVIGKSGRFTPISNYYTEV